ncbi:hypothetical protein [Umezawaea sp. Da 62-37]|nr:hypothetical protein [Umezawaea sp. Da 62-37]WNV86169.1 hypothetical protein RM788_50005 [Umezawaea sp. Da 62-37]
MTTPRTDTGGTGGPPATAVAARTRDTRPKWAPPVDTVTLVGRP